MEAGAELAGGHSIDDKEPKYGLAVTGVARPDEIVYNAGARPGDKLVLTKRLGIGRAGQRTQEGLITEDDMMPPSRRPPPSTRPRRPSCRRWACMPAPT